MFYSEMLVSPRCHRRENCGRKATYCPHVSLKLWAGCGGHLRVSWNTAQRCDTRWTSSDPSHIPRGRCPGSLVALSPWKRLRVCEAPRRATKRDKQSEKKKGECEIKRLTLSCINSHTFVLTKLTVVSLSLSYLALELCQIYLARCPEEVLTAMAE